MDWRKLSGPLFDAGLRILATAIGGSKPILGYDPEGYNCPRVVHPNIGRA